MDEYHRRTQAKRTLRNPGTVVVLSVVNLVVLCAGFIMALMADRDWYEDVWQWLTDFSALSRFVWWMLMLPMAVLLWGWRSPATLVRLFVLAGVALGAVAAAVGLAKVVRWGGNEGSAHDTDGDRREPGRGATTVPGQRNTPERQRAASAERRRY